LTSHNKFEILASRVIRYGVKGKVKIRRQEITEKKERCFRYCEIGYFKWKCLNIEVKREKRRSKKATCVASLQKA